MSKVIEAVARAIYDAELADDYKSPISDEAWCDWWKRERSALRRLYAPKARAAIEALAASAQKEVDAGRYCSDIVAFLKDAANGKGN